MKTTWLSIFLLAGCIAGCTESNNTVSPSTPAVDDFGVPAGFRSGYTIAQEENTTAFLNAPRWTAHITVPTGLSNADLENNMRAAAEETFKKHPDTHNIMIFANKPGTGPTGPYTAGRLQWAPHGDWMKADEDVSVAEHQAVVDIADDYRPKPKPKPTAADKKFAAQDAAISKSEKRDEARVARHLPESVRRRIYYASKQVVLDAMDHPERNAVPGDPDASMAASDKAICRRYHISQDDLGTIHDEGDDKDWPAPQ